MAVYCARPSCRGRTFTQPIRTTKIVCPQIVRKLCRTSVDVRGWFRTENMASDLQLYRVESLAARSRNEQNSPFTPRRSLVRSQYRPHKTPGPKPDSEHLPAQHHAEGAGGDGRQLPIAHESAIRQDPPRRGPALNRHLYCQSPRRPPGGVWPSAGREISPLVRGMNYRKRPSSRR